MKYVRPGNGFVPDPRIDFYHKTEVNGKNEDEMYKFLKVRIHFNISHTAPDLQCLEKVNRWQMGEWAM